MKTAAIVFAAICLTMATQAGELYRLKPNTVIVGERLDLDELMKLNAQGKKAELRALYSQLKAARSLVDAPPGIVVEVVSYNSGSVGDMAQIKWSGFSDCPFQVGYIAKSDLAHRAGSQ
jgi:hypothetical protein